VIVKQETKQKRNKTKRNKQKRNETKRDTTETKRNEARRDTTETKRNQQKSSINKITKQTLTKRFFLHETKYQWRIEKPLKFTGIWENFVQPPPLQST
jgi:hypothetical protein